MHTGYRLLLSVLLVFFTAGNAYPFTMTRFFASSGNPATAPLVKAGKGSLHGISGYAVPEGIELRKDINYEYYPVFGKSYSGILNSAAENGPFIRSMNRRSPSTIDWGFGISYHYDYTYEIDEELQTVHALIDISDVSINYEITVTLPALLDDTSLNAVEKKLWKSYFHRLLEREHGRADVIRDEDTRKKIEDAVKEIKGLSFDYTSDSDIEQSVEFFLGEETDRIGREWAKKISEKLEGHEKKEAVGTSPQGVSPVK